MASATARVIGFLSIFLLLLPFTVASGFLAPLLSPIFEDVCKQVECGKGTCKPSRNGTSFFECDCEPGWKQARSEDDDNLKFLPCIIPNCTLNHACKEGSSPVQEKSSNNTDSLFDPCHWADCGGGSCNQTSRFTYKCVCSEGYSNLLNMRALPCFSECSIGVDCKGLGISPPNQSAPPTASLADNTHNKASSILEGKMHWLVILIVSLLVAPWK